MLEEDVVGIDELVAELLVVVVALLHERDFGSLGVLGSYIGRIDLVPAGRLVLGLLDVDVLVGADLRPRGTQALVSFAPLALSCYAPLVRTLFFAARPSVPVKAFLSLPWKPEICQADLPKRKASIDKNRISAVIYLPTPLVGSTWCLASFFPRPLLNRPLKS